MAEAIGYNPGLARNSVSKDLNQLWNDGQAIKSRGRPVFFLHRLATESLLERRLEEHEREVRSVANLRVHQENHTANDSFTNLTGYDPNLQDTARLQLAYRSGDGQHPAGGYCQADANS